MSTANPQANGLLLSASLTLTTNQVKAVGNTTLLEVPDRTPMLLDEIRVSGSEGGSALNVLVRLQLGRNPLTNGYVPFGVLSKLINSEQNGDATGVESLPESIVWRLPRPLYVPAGEIVTASFLANGSVTSTNVVLTYAGRSVLMDYPVPKKIAIPWVTAFLPTRRAGGSNTTQESTNSDLVNTLGVPLHAQRLVGLMSGDTDALEALCLMQMRTSYGQVIIRDQVPFANVFSTERCWDLGSVMKPKDYYIVNLTENYATVNPAHTVSSAISLVGYREVDFV